MRRYGLLLEIKEIVKRRGEESVLCGLSLDFKEKGIYGVLGAEGAGKTTLAEIICGCRDTDDGEITVDGEKMSRSAYKLKTRVRLVPTDLVADGSMTPVEYLDFVGDSLGVESDKKYRQIKEAIELNNRIKEASEELGALYPIRRHSDTLATPPLERRISENSFENSLSHGFFPTAKGVSSSTSR